MTYVLTVRNSSDTPLETPDGGTIKAGESWVSKPLGNTYLHSPEIGSMSFRDLGEEHIGGDSEETWGVLIGYQGSHMVGRHEGGGTLNVAFDNHLQAVVSGMNLRHVRLDPLVTEPELHPTPVKT